MAGFSIANAVVQAPFVLLMALCCSTPVYWITDMNDDPLRCGARGYDDDVIEVHETGCPAQAGSKELVPVVLIIITNCSEGEGGGGGRRAGSRGRHDAPHRSRHDENVTSTSRSFSKISCSEVSGVCVRRRSTCILCVPSDLKSGRSLSLCPSLSPLSLLPFLLSHRHSRSSGTSSSSFRCSSCCSSSKA